MEIPASAAVVTENVPDMPPTLSVADVVVRFADDESNCTATLCPLVMDPAADVNGPPLIEYCPPMIEIGLATLMPLIIAGLDVKS